MASQEHTEKDFLTCTICLDILKEPKSLLCMHRFCESCLNTHIISSVGSSVFARSFLCPLCRISVAAPNISSPPSMWAAQFRTDFYLKGLTEVVQSRTEVPESNVSKITNPKCLQHADKECGFYCVDCCQTSCETCAVLSHRACNQMLTVEDAAKDRRAALRSLVNKISTQVGEAVGLESLHEDYMRNVEEKKAHIEQKIRESADKLRQLVSIEEEKLLTHLEKNYDGLQEQASLQVSTFEEAVNKARQAIKNASTITMSSSDFDLLSDTSCCDALAECDLAKVTDEHTLFCKKLSEVKCLFQKGSVPDITLGKCKIVYNLSDDDTSIKSNSARNKEGPSHPLPTSTVWPQLPVKQSYAQLVKTSTSNKPKDALCEAITSGKPKDALCGVITRGKPEETLAIMSPTDFPAGLANKVIRTIKTRLRHDRQKPCLNGLVVLVPSDTVLVTDWANKSVKAFPNKRGKSRDLTLDCHPWAITQVSHTSAAVSLPSSQQICFIQLSPVLDIDEYIKVPKSYIALAAFSSFDSVIIVAGSCHNSGGQVASVDFLTPRGQVLKSFTNDSNGLPLFKDPAYLCVTPDKLIVVSDVEHKTVKYVTLDGELKLTYPPEGAECLRHQKGVACDPTGRVVLVVDGDLLTLTSDGQLEKILASSKDSLLRISGTLFVDRGVLVYVVDNDEDIKVLKSV